MQDTPDFFSWLEDLNDENIREDDILVTVDMNGPIQSLTRSGNQSTKYPRLFYVFLSFKYSHLIPPVALILLLHFLEYYGKVT